MTTGFRIAGVVMILLGAASLFAVAYSVLNCPYGSICTANPAWIVLGGILPVVGVFLLFARRPTPAERRGDPAYWTRLAALAGVPPAPGATSAGTSCSACGAPSAAGATFCNHCGKPIG